MNVVLELETNVVLHHLPCLEEVRALHSRGTHQVKISVCKNTWNSNHKTKSVIETVLCWTCFKCTLPAGPKYFIQIIQIILSAALLHRPCNCLVLR